MTRTLISTLLAAALLSAAAVPAAQAYDPYSVSQATGGQFLQKDVSSGPNQTTGGGDGDFQDRVNKQNQTMSLLSSILKKQHDTNKSIISKF